MNEEINLEDMLGANPDDPEVYERAIRILEENIASDPDKARFISFQLSPMLFSDLFFQVQDKIFKFATPDHLPLRYDMNIPIFERFKKFPEFLNQLGIAEATYYNLIYFGVGEKFRAESESHNYEKMDRMMDTLSAFVSMDPDKYRVEKDILESSGYGNTDRSEDIL